LGIIFADGLQFTLEQNINKVNLTQLLSNVEKQDENNISASAKTQDNNQQRIKIKTLEVRKWCQ
jgi:hypothetical protein